MIEILDAMLDQLRTGPKAFTTPTLNHKNSGIAPEGRPKPASPEFFLAIDEEGTDVPRGENAQFDLWEVFRVAVYINIRTGRTAADRFDEIYRRNKLGLKVITRQVLRAIHGQQALRIAANNLLDEDEAEFTRPLYCTGIGKVEIKASDWSGEVADASPTAAGASGWLVRKITFKGLHRIQYLDSIT